MTDETPISSENQASTAVADPTPEQLAAAEALQTGVPAAQQINDRAQLQSDAERMRAYLNDQIAKGETVSVRIPKVRDNQHDEIVTINGFVAAVLKPGERVTVPKLVAEVLEQGNRI